MYDSEIQCYKCVCKVSSPPFCLTSSRNYLRKNNKYNSNNNLIIKEKNELKLLTIPPSPPSPISIQFSEESTITFTPLLTKYFPFIKRGIEDIINRIDQKLPNYLSKLPNYKSDPKVVIKYQDEDNREIKTVVPLHSCIAGLMEFFSSSPEEVYRRYDFVEMNMRHVANVNVSSEREELSFQGDNINDFIYRYNNNMFYLDKYGNKCKMPHMCFLDAYLQYIAY